MATNDKPSAVQHYEGAPGATKGKSLTAWQDFEGELRNREREIASMLPTHITRERFLNSATAAVKQNPDLLKATPRSLFSAVTKSAQDGILPDGREGVITVYGDQASWNPMTYGLRKRARELDEIIIDAQVVYENDKFIWHQGDDPHIEHVPAKLGQPRGPKIGAYAIFKRETGPILHREVMDTTQIQTVRNQSRAQNSLMWTKFEEEGYRKTVIRRGIKSVPVSENLEQIVRRDDDLFDFDTKTENLLVVPPRPVKESEFARPTPPAATATEKPAGGQAPQMAHEPEPERQASPAQPQEPEQAVQAEPEPVPEMVAKAEPEQAPAEREPGDDGEEPQEETALQRGIRLLPMCKTANDVGALDETIVEELTSVEDMRAWSKATKVRVDEILAAAQKQSAPAKAAPAKKGGK